MKLFLTHKKHSIPFKIFLENEKCSQPLREIYQNHKAYIKEMYEFKFQLDFC